MRHFLPSLPLLGDGRSLQSPPLPFPQHPLLAWVLILIASGSCDLILVVVGGNVGWVSPPRGWQMSRAWAISDGAIALALARGFLLGLESNLSAQLLDRNRDEKVARLCEASRGPSRLRAPSTRVAGFSRVSEFGRSVRGGAESAWGYFRLRSAGRRDGLRLEFFLMGDARCDG